MFLDQIYPIRRVMDHPNSDGQKEKEFGIEGIWNYYHHFYSSVFVPLLQQTDGFLTSCVTKPVFREVQDALEAQCKKSLIREREMGDEERRKQLPM